MKKVVAIKPLDHDEDLERLQYWLSKTPLERWNAISDLRVQRIKALGLIPGNIEKVVKKYSIHDLK